MNEHRKIINEPSVNQTAMEKVFDKMYITNVEKRLRELNNPSDNDRKRWIWELIQNAKDTIANNASRDKINIRIEIENDIVRFKHNGDPFTAEARWGLLYKYSDAKENQESTGRFGTGFLTTHCLSKIVTIESNQFKDEEHSNLCGFKVTMYRDGNLASELIDGLHKMRKSQEFYAQPLDWTTFTYHINSDSGREAIRLGVENFYENIAPTMLFCQELNSVELNDRGHITTIHRNPIQKLENDIFLAEFEMRGEKKCTRRFIFTHFEEHNDKLSARYKANRSIRLDAAVEIDGDNCLVEHKWKPSHFCVLPLVGIENQLTEPIIINCPDFEPDSERQSLLLNGVDWNHEKNIITETGINRIIYSKIFPLFEKIVSFLSQNNYGKLYYLAYGLGKAIAKTNNLDDKWYEENIINTYRNILLKYPVIKAFKGNCRLKLSDCIIAKGTKEKETDLFNLLSYLYPSRLAADNHEWSMFAWKDGLRVWGTEDLCKDIESKENLSNIQLTGKQLNVWYNEFLDFIFKDDERLLKEYALLPNLNGSFLKKDEKDFKQGEHINPFIIALVEQLGKDLKPLLLHSEITSVSLEAKYNSQSYSADVNKLALSIINAESTTENEKVMKLLPLLSVIPNDAEKYKVDYIKRRNNYYNIFVSIHQLKDADISNDNSLLESAWKETDIWFESHILQHLKQFGCLSELPGDLDAHWLNNCLKALNIQTSRLNDYAVLPNQNGKFCMHKDLFRDEQIPTELKDEVFDTVELNYKNILLHNDIDASSFAIEQSKSIATFANELKTKFSNVPVRYDAYYFRNSYHKYSQDVLDKIARYVISILPTNKTSELYEHLCIIYNISKQILGSEINFAEREICYESIDLWQDANVYVANQIAEKIFKVGSLEKLCTMLGNCGEKNAIELLNKFYRFVSHNNIKFATLPIFPNQNGIFRTFNDLKYEDGNIDDILKDIIYHLVSEEEDYRNILLDKRCDLHPQIAVTIEDAFKLIDDIVSVSYNDSIKRKDERYIKAVHLLLEVYNKVYHDNFPKTYTIKDTILIEVVWPQEKREKLMKINDKLTDEQIESILENDAKIEELTNKVNQLERYISQLSVIQEIKKKYPEFDFSSVLDILEKEQGEFSLSDVEHNVSDERKREIGDKGECFVYELLCDKFGKDNVEWSNKADINNYEYKRTFQGKDYYFIRTRHDFDFKLQHHSVLCYIEVKTTVGSVKNCSDFPLFFQTKEWEWIDNNTTQNASHYVIRVFDIEKEPKAYFLKQTLEID